MQQINFNQLQTLPLQFNMEDKSFSIFFSKIVLVTIFLVILAGSVVRSTQSGMGCPDWPKCFGQYVPPTQMEQVLFQPNKQYKKGQFIRHNDSLWSSVQNFKSANNFEVTNWKYYNKHGYTKIVIYQTWIEYINRLLGALLGLLILIQTILSLKNYKKQKAIFWLGVLLLLLTGFQAWLGKTVVDSNLATIKISVHLAGALALCFVQLAIIYLLKPQTIIINKKLNILFVILCAVSIVQFFMGVIIRQHIDIISEKYNFTRRENWLSEIGTIFYFHRSFSLLVLALAFIINHNANAAFKVKFALIKYLILAQLAVGIVFNYFSFPALAQPLHLTLASMQLSYLFYLALVKKQ